MTKRDVQSITAITTPVMIAALRRVHRDIEDMISHDPASAFEPLLIGTRQKRAIGLDWYVECRMACELRRRFGATRVKVLGEETLRDPNVDVTNEPGLVVLNDILDGSDLAERWLGNWCSASVVFYPRERRILAAYVAVPDMSAVYCVTEAMPVPVRYPIRKRGSQRTITGPSKVRDLKAASIAYYGQKPGNYLSLMQNTKVASFLRSLSDQQEEGKDFGFRLYTLGGIPQMVRVVDGHRQMDAVVDACGQNPHDAVAGLYLAQHGGATVIGLNGKPIDLAASLLRPADPEKKLRYILAATPELADSLVAWFDPERPSSVIAA
jgi:hypothetical protein